MSAEYSSGDTSPLKGPAPKAQPEDTSDVDKPEDSMPLTSGSPTERPVQFISNAPTNGDAKVEIGDGTAPVFVGLGKEELMKYANDPFWVKLRWFLFILFWILWVAMLAGAIVIIVLAPKCAEKKVEPEAYYELNLKTFAKEGKLSELGARAEYLSGLGVSTVIISDVLKKDDGGTVDFKAVDESYGTNADFADAVKKLKTAGLRVLMTIIPNHFGLKHPWFTEKPEFYIQKPAEEVAQSVWKTADGTGSAWATLEGNDTIKYLQQFSRNVDLDFRNKDVVSEMRSILDSWKAKGVDGFLISDASYLVENLNQLNNANATINQPENLDVLKQILNKRPNDIANLVEVKDLSADDIAKYAENGIVALPVQTIADQIGQSTTAEKIMEVFQGIHNNSELIRITNSDTPSSMSPETKNILRLLAYTTNASVVASSEEHKDDLADPANKNDTTYNFLSDLVKLRKSFEDGGKEENEALFKYPEEDSNKNIIAIIRSNRYIVLANMNSSEVEINLRKYFKDTEVIGSILLATPNTSFPAGDAVEDKVNLPGNSAIVIQLNHSHE